MFHRRSSGCAVPADGRDGEASEASLPVLEAAVLEFECSMKDPKERHLVCKLERYDLEDRYLRLLDELQALKKHCNAQEDKLKRLATKLVRSGGVAPAAAYLADDRDRIELLQAENAKLRDKVCLLRAQLANSKIFARSPSRSRRLALGSGSSSAPITCRSESSGRAKVSSCRCGETPTPAPDGSDEAEKKALLDRIAELQGELASLASGSRREKVAENVEYIRVWRQMKRQNEKLLAAQSANELLNEQIRHLKGLLQESCKNSEQVAAALEAERKQVAQLDESVSKARCSQLDLKERDERIADLLNELDILQQHNRELIELSSKFAKVEQENAELKRKVADQQLEQQLLKDAFDKEKANSAALEAANQQLLIKLHELQTNIDLMTVQLAAQNERNDKASLKKSKRVSEISTSEEKSATSKPTSKESFEACKKCCDDVKTDKPAQCEKGIQTFDKSELTNESTQTEKLLDFYSAKLTENAFVKTWDNNKSKTHLPQNGNSLSREGMLKLLEQVQISSPLESQNAARVRHTETSAVPLRVSRPASNLETFLFGESAL